jgi:hypothetical protein
MTEWDFVLVSQTLGPHLLKIRSKRLPPTEFLADKDP